MVNDWLYNIATISAVKKKVSDNQFGTCTDKEKKPESM